METADLFSRWEYRVAGGMTDAFGFCRVSDTLRFMQESAAEQLERYGPDAQTLREQGRAFFLSRISMDLPVPLFRGTRVFAETYPGATSRGFSFDRCYRLFSEGDVPAACAFSQWAMLDVRKKTLIRLEDSGYTYSRDDPVTVSIPLRFRIPRDAEMISCGEKTVRYADIDANGHMNNTHYPDLVCDFLPELAEFHPEEPVRVTAFAAAFLHEAPLGEVLRVSRTAAPDGTGLYYFRTVRASDGEVNMEAAVRVEKV